MNEESLNNIKKIIKNDLKATRSSTIVTIVIITMVVLPSLYALLNIHACWDPYGNTGNIEFAIANLDEGTTFNGVHINIGNKLVEEFKNNDKFQWKFVSEKELRDGVYTGRYFAGIVIPKDLSEDVASIVSDNPKQAKLDYIVNIKANPVASKIADSAANSVYTSLNSKIVSFINIAAYGQLEDLQAGLADGASQLAGGAGQLQNGANQVSAGAGQVKGGAGQLHKGVNGINMGANQVKKGSNQIKKGSEELESVADSSLIPDGPVKKYIDGSSQLANGTARLADGSVQLANGSTQLAGGANDLAEGSVSLAAGAELLGSSAAEALFTASGSLGATANQLSAFTGLNESRLDEYFLSPIKLDREEWFSVPAYGSNVAPFYIVLSMWVGALLTCVMMEPKSSIGSKYSPFELYIGKFVLYLILSILQASVTIIGCYILGVHIIDNLLFIFTSLTVSIVFMILIYAIISATGALGKGLLVILLVLQISGSGGIYPIQIMNNVSQIFYPFLPMTYAINIIREAQLGVVWGNYIPSLFIVLAIGIVSFIVGKYLKEKSDKSSKYFEERLEESGLF